MSQPVKLSDPLVLEARVIGEAVHRSISGQVEFWATLGKAVEPFLQGSQVLSLCRSNSIQSLAECLQSVDTPSGQARLQSFLEEQPFPHYESEPGKRGLLVRISEDGTRTLGRFVNREFKPEVPVDAKI
jgi:hypothetical protein